MKNLIVFIVLSFIIVNISFWIYTPGLSIKQYLDKEIEYNNEIFSFSNEEFCERWIILNKIFEFLKKNWFLDVKNMWFGEYFEWLVNFSKKDKTDNFKTRSIFPYVNNSFLKDWKWFNFLCSWNNLVYIAWWFETKWTIEIDSWYSIYLENQSTSSQNLKPINYSKIYMKLDNYDNNFPFIDNWRLFIWCIQDIDYSNYLHYIKSNIIWNKIIYEMESVHLRIYKSINWIAKPQDIKNQNIWKYKDWDKINIRFYIDPWFIPRFTSLECENPWMLKYEILE